MGAPTVLREGTTVLLGRDAVLDELAAFLVEAASEGGVRLVWGDAGVGKSVLLDRLCDTAAEAGTAVLRATGTQFEAELPYSVLDLLLRPVQHQVAGLTPGLAAPLAVALGLEEGPPPDRVVVARAVLALLGGATLPTLCVVDDLQWVDQASAGVLSLLARQLEGTSVALLGGYRSGHESFFDRRGLPDQELLPLDARAAAALVASTHPLVAPAVLRRIVETAQGNPLALVELPHALSVDQLNGKEPLPPVLPMGRRLEALFASRVHALPRDARQDLLCAALDPTGDLDLLCRSMSSGAPSQLASAEAARLVLVDRQLGRLRFRHPLVRSTFVELSTTSERQAAHRRLGAAEQDEERRAWHLAEAATTPDEQVARMLERVAHLVLDRGDAAGAVTALVRAAHLTPDQDERARRLAEAAFFGVAVTGHLRTAADVLAELRRTNPGMAGSLNAAIIAATIMINGDSDADTAFALLAGVLDARGEVLDVRDPEVVEACFQLLQLCWIGHADHMWARLEGLLARLAPTIPDELDLMFRATHEPVACSDELLDRLDLTIARLPGETNPLRLTRMSSAAFAADRGEGCSVVLRPLVAAAREADGTVGAAALPALMGLTWQAFLTGRWEECEQTAEEGLELGLRLGYGQAPWVMQLSRAAVAAGRGHSEAVRRVTDQVMGWAVPRRVGSAVEFVHLVRALDAVGRRDHESAYREVTSIVEPGVIGRGYHRPTWFVLDLTEAAVRTGRLSQAIAHAAALRDAGVAEMSPRGRLLTLAAEGMTTRGDEAHARLSAAVAVPGAELWAFEHARVRLLYGEHLRRERLATDARVQLEHAVRTFRRIGATPWLDRATSELEAAGARRSGGSRPLADPETSLTPQERQVATLAAEGLTNREIGQRLSISPRTVGIHLYRVFPKLGVATRAGLRDALDAQAVSSRPSVR